MFFSLFNFSDGVFHAVVNFVYTIFDLSVAQNLTVFGDSVNTEYSYYFQVPVTKEAEGIIYLHNVIFCFLVGILFLVLYLYGAIFYSNIVRWNKGRQTKKLNALKNRKIAFPFELDNKPSEFASYYKPNYKVNLNNESFYYKGLQFLRFKNLTHSSHLEVFWTVLPAIILMCIAYPSFALLYAMDEVADYSVVTVVATGAQWFWEYSYRYSPVFLLALAHSAQIHGHCSFNVVDILGWNLSKIPVFQKLIEVFPEFNETITRAHNSYMVPEDELRRGEPRLLITDNVLHLPTDVPIKVVVTAKDVLHSWAVPSLGVKIDGIPGRLNQTTFVVERAGVYYGQCSEICGVNHGFMPITIVAEPLDKWYYNSGLHFDQTFQSKFVEPYEMNDGDVDEIYDALVTSPEFLAQKAKYLDPILEAHLSKRFETEWFEKQRLLNSVWSGEIHNEKLMKFCEMEVELGYKVHMHKKAKFLAMYDSLSPEAKEIEVIRNLMEAYQRPAPIESAYAELLNRRRQ